MQFKQQGSDHVTHAANALNKKSELRPGVNLMAGIWQRVSGNDFESIP
jgi:hypothetical protein